MNDQDLDDTIRCDFANPLGRCVLAAGHYPGTAHRYGPEPMPEPTDHRAEAERFVLSAVDSWANADTGNEDEVRTRIGYAISEALIGIGHALLALTEKPSADDTRCESRFHGERCVLYASHRGDHRLTWTPVD